MPLQQQQLQRLQPQRRLRQLLFLLGFKILPMTCFISFNEMRIDFYMKYIENHYTR